MPPTSTFEKGNEIILRTWSLE